MKTISLATATQILSDCAAIITEDHTVTYPLLHDENDINDEWLTLSWEDGEFNEFDISFTQKDNEQIEIVGSAMFLKKTDGEIIRITILETKNLEA